jgi:biotin-dependent carboxylase-like uncharacterized protein
VGEITVIKSGMLTTVQDRGRFGYRQYGVPVSGAMDQVSALLANILVNNQPGDAVLEITMLGPELYFNQRALIAITGADMSPALDEKPVGMHEVVNVMPGQVLSFGRLKLGIRSYLAIRGGIMEKEILGSRSYYSGLTACDKLFAGQVIPIKDAYFKENALAKVRINQNHFQDSKIEVFKGPEFGLLPNSHQDILLNTVFEIGPQNNRMGYVIPTKGLELDTAASMITSGVMPGTVQLTPSGKLVVLMRDCQTTGGYYRVLQLTENAISQLAQKKAGDKFFFKLNDG